MVTQQIKGLMGRQDLTILLFSNIPVVVVELEEQVLGQQEVQGLEVLVWQLQLLVLQKIMVQEVTREVGLVVQIHPLQVLAELEEVLEAQVE